MRLMYFEYALLTMSFIAGTCTASAGTMETLMGLGLVCREDMVMTLSQGGVESAWHSLVDHGEKVELAIFLTFLTFLEARGHSFMTHFHTCIIWRKFYHLFNIFLI